MERSRKRGALVLLVVLVALFVPPFLHVNRYRGQLASSIGKTLGRPVTLGSITLRLLPQPGFDIENFVIGDDPAFSAEPLLTAEKVNVWLRLSSLWRGHIEVARMNFENPSLNLVHGHGGHWNVESLFLRASQVPSAPTGKQGVEWRPRFPYISFETGRINFKEGPDKRAFALSDADFAVWLAREDQWEFRLGARPMRTDMALSDSGSFKIIGTFNRAGSLAEIPLNVRFQWQKAQLGQLSKLLDDKDHGWRGGITVAGTARGTSANLNLTSDLTIADFRRFDFTPVDGLDLQAACSGRFSSITQVLDQILCQAPAGGGEVNLRGSVALPGDRRHVDLTLSANHIPAAFLVRLLRHVKGGVANDLRAAGQLNAVFSLPPDGPITGSAALNGLILQSPELQPELNVGELQVSTRAVAGKNATEIAPSRKTRAALKKSTPRGANPLHADLNSLQLVPVSLSLGGDTLTRIAGGFSREGYSLSLSGDAPIARLLQLGRALGFPGLRNSVRGGAKVSLIAEGSWAGYQPPIIRGSAELKDVTADIPGIREKLTFPSANLLMDSKQATLSGFTASIEGTQIGASGSVAVQRGCNLQNGCNLSFELRTDDLDMDEVHDLLTEPGRERRWFPFGRSENTVPAFVTGLAAQGTFNARHLRLKKATLQEVSSKVSFTKGHAEFNGLRAKVFDGAFTGAMVADFTGKEPLYHASGSLQKISLGQISTGLHNDFASGTASLRYDLQFSGSTAGGIASSLAGEIDFSMPSGILKHLSGAGKTLPFSSWNGTAKIAHETITLENSKMLLFNASREVAGSLGFKKDIDLTFRSATEQARISGTFDSPKFTTEPIPAFSASK